MIAKFGADYKSPSYGDIEIIERKGLGHPDTLADGIAEACSIAYANYCLEKFGYIPHHNLDKAALMGGLCKQVYGGSDFLAPLRLLLMGRASRNFGDESIPLEEIQLKAASEYLARVMPHLDIDDPNVLTVETLTSSYSTRNNWYSPRNVGDLPEYANYYPAANDTATMISYWPLTDSEQLTLDLEGYFYKDNEYGLPTPRFDYIGQDIKVMTVRNGNAIRATICVPQVTTNTPDEQTYYKRERQIEKDLQHFAKSKLPGKNIEIIVNTQTKGTNPRPYLVTGGSCTDFGEEGAVGRGNKTHGIISSYRPNTMEAPHGKNPTYFVGKILGYLADMIAKSIYDELGKPCQVVLQANMGDNLFAPSTILVSTEGEVDEVKAQEIVDRWFAEGREITTRIIEEMHFLPHTNSFKGKYV